MKRVFKRLVPLFRGAPEAPDYSDEPPEIGRALSHRDWHRAYRKPFPCDLCAGINAEAEAAQRWHEHGLRRTP